ncbi:MAG: signal peptidase II [Clostridium sp.]|nr:signal peptidase II [Clostridium sp.]
MNKGNGHKTKLLLMDLLLLFFLVAIDQFTKSMAVLKLKGQKPFSIIKDVLELSYLENRGAAFSMLENHKTFFIVVAIIFLCIIVYVLFKTPDEKKYLSLNLLLTTIAAGALGNMMDRLRLDYVVDFIYIVLINFPIFNVADIYVTFATAILVIQVFWVYKEDDFEFLFHHNRGDGGGEN